jgi:hypothetical protein
VFNTLIHRQDAHVSCAGEAAMVVNRLNAAEHLGAAVALGEYPVYEVTAGKVDAFFGDGFAFVVEQVLGLVTKE